MKKIIIITGQVNNVFFLNEISFIKEFFDEVSVIAYNDKVSSRFIADQFGFKLILTNQRLLRYFFNGSFIKWLFDKDTISEILQTFSFSISESTILHIGRFSTQKNHFGLVRCFKEINNSFPNTKLLLIGDGELVPQVHEYVDQLGLHEKVEFLGLQTDVFRYLVKADIFVLPSLWEGMPISLIEAMATGIPIVATAVGGVPDMIKNQHSGLLVNLDDTSFISAVEKLLKNEFLREKLGRNAVIDAQQYTSLLMSTNYLKVYSNLKGKS